MLTTAVVVYYAISIVFGIILFKRQFISPTLIFLLTQLFMFSGILIRMDTGLSSDRLLIYMYLIALIMIVLGDSISNAISPIRKTRLQYLPQSAPTRYQRLVIAAIVGVSILACVYLFVSAGSNIFINIIRAFSSSSDIDVTESRLEMYGIVGLGYIYQFRVILLPVLSAYILSFTKYKKLGLLLLPVMIVFALGTGQRGGFMIFGMMWISALLWASKLSKGKHIVGIVVVCGIVVGLFGIMTVANGRVSGSSDSAVLTAVIERFTKDNQLTALIGFRYIYTEPCQHGHDWLMMFKDLLPGKNDYLPLANRIFAIMYGSTIGTAPPCIWGSVYYNFGIFGVPAVAFLLGFFFHRLTNRFYKYPVTNLRLMVYCAMFVALGVWIADSPMFLFNQGFITLGILGLILRVDKDAERRVAVNR